MFYTIKKIGAAAIVYMLSVGCAFADTTVNNLTIDKIGAQNTTYYFYVTTSALDSCLWHAMYVDATTTFGASAWKVLLAAKFSGRQLSRIDYTVSADGSCHLTVVEIQN